MSRYLEHLAEDRRLALLRLLEEAGGSANESVLHIGIHQLGHRRGVTRDVVCADIEWLAERHLVTVEYYQDRVVVATLTPRGLHAAHGDVTVEGVKQPSIA